MQGKSYLDIEPLPPEHLWKGWIPLGTPVYLAGAGGCGKGLICADLLARVTRGDRMPDGSESDVPSGNTLTVLPEDDPNTAVAWRLRAAGADLGRVFDFTEGFSLPSGLPQLGREMDRIYDDTGEPVRLVILDPLSAMSEVHLSSGAKRIRSALTNPLEHFVRERGCALIIVVHFTKDGKTVQGSKTITDAARVVLGARKLGDGMGTRQLYVDKGNSVRDDATFAYKIEGSSVGTHVEWLDAGVGLDNPDQRAQDKIAAVLAEAYGEALTVQDIQSRAGTAYGATRTALTRLSRTEGSGVVNVERGFWGQGIEGEET